MSDTDDDPNSKRHKWTYMETQSLIEEVIKYGAQWVYIGKKLGLRPEQCSNRYIAKGPHVTLRLSSDDKTLIRIMQIQDIRRGRAGNNWRAFSYHFPHHSYFEIKNFGRSQQMREVTSENALLMLANIAIIYEKKTIN